MVLFRIMYTGRVLLKFTCASSSWHAAEDCILIRPQVLDRDIVLSGHLLQQSAEMLRVHVRAIII